MIIFYIIPMLIGLSIVAQGTLNEVIGQERGLGYILFVNGLVFFALCVTLAIASLKFANVFSWLPPFKESNEPFHWYYLVPGICGFFIVLGAPIAITNLGAASFFISLVVSQIFLSLLYDTLIQSIPVSTTKILGSLLACAGAALFAYSKN